MNTGKSDIILERMMLLHPKIIDLTLDRMWRLLAAMDHPERRLPPVIHIAGTNGKGSTLATIRAGLEAKGHLVNAYTSPHLARFHERIRVDSALISEADLTAVLDECERANGGVQITYFEITTCAALVAFSRSRADYTLLEVGLGGRLDATNVVEQPKLSIITPVSIDHQQFLGNTIEEIAAEKAGILKRNVPCIVGKQNDAALEVIEHQATRVGAPLLVYGQHWHVAEEHGRMVFQDESGLLDLPLPRLIGAHQVHNAGTALAALRQLGADEAQCEAAVLNTEWPARMQRLRQGPLIDSAPEAEFWLDGGHNAAAGEALAEALLRLPSRPTHLICGMMNTKDVVGYMRPLSAVATSLHAVSIPGEAATLPAEETCQIANSVGIKAVSAETVAAAVAEICALQPRARILICGSLYLAGSVLRQNT